MNVPHPPGAAEGGQAIGASTDWSAEALRAQAAGAIGARDWGAAISALGSVLAIDADPHSAAFLVLALRENGQREEASRIGTEYMGRFPGSPRIAIETALVEFVRRDWEAARIAFQFVRDHFPFEPDAYMRGAAVAEELQDHRSMSALSEVGLRLFPSHEGLLVQAAELAERRHDWGDALRRWRDCLAQLEARARFYERSVAIAVRLPDHDLAETLATAGRDAFPQDLELARAWANVSSTRLDWREAKRRWLVVRNAFPDDERARTSLGEAEWNEAYETERDGGATRASTPTTAAGATPERSLMLRFEGLGDNCEFGIVQRHYGAEPLGLYRWAGVLVDRLVDALDADFEGVGEPENVLLKCRPGAMYTVEDKRGLFISHTFIFDGQMPFEKLHASQITKIGFLRQKLLDDLQDAEKIFLFKPRDGRIPDRDILRLHDALARHGDNTLLCVRRSEAPHRNATATRLRDKVFVGYLDRVSLEARKEEIDFPSWLAMLAAVADLAQAPSRQDA